VIDGPFRKVFPGYVAPLIAIYQRLGLKPNHVTIIGFLCALAAAYCVGKGWTVGALILWWVGRLFDGTDGIYARATDQQSDFGGYLDIVLDMASYGVMILGFALLHPAYSLYWMVVLLLYILCITTALAFGTLAEKNGVVETDNRSLSLAAGLAEGGETGIAYTLFLLFPAWTWVLLPLWIAVLLTTVVARSALAWELLSESEETEIGS
jgi:phosphatidylglycerophosphate synthase